MVCDVLGIFSFFLDFNFQSLALICSALVWLCNIMFITLTTLKKTSIILILQNKCFLSVVLLKVLRCFSKDYLHFLITVTGFHCVLTCFMVSSKLYKLSHCKHFRLTYFSLRWGNCCSTILKLIRPNVGMKTDNCQNIYEKN